MAAKMPTRAGKKTYKDLKKPKKKGRAPSRRGPGGNTTVSKARKFRPANSSPDRPGGRPRTDITAGDIYNLSKLQCTLEEIAGFFGVSASTLYRHMEADNSLREAYEEGKQYGRVSLRRLQFACAASKQAGSAALLIWLGKQYLGQTDKVLNANVDAKDWASAVKDALRTDEATQATAEAPQHHDF